MILEFYQFKDIIVDIFNHLNMTFMKLILHQKDIQLLNFTHAHLISTLVSLVKTLVLLLMKIMINLFKFQKRIIMLKQSKLIKVLYGLPSKESLLHLLIIILQIISIQKGKISPLAKLKLVMMVILNGIQINKNMILFKLNLNTPFVMNAIQMEFKLIIRYLLHKMKKNYKCQVIVVMNNSKIIKPMMKRFFKKVYNHIAQLIIMEVLFMKLSFLIYKHLNMLQSELLPLLIIS